MDTFVKFERYTHGVMYNIYQVDFTILFARIINDTNRDDYLYFLYDDVLDDILKVLNRMFEINEPNLDVGLYIYYHGLVQLARHITTYYPKYVDVKNLIKLYKLLEIPKIVQHDYRITSKTQLRFVPPKTTFNHFHALNDACVSKLKKHLENYTNK